MCWLSLGFVHLVARLARLAWQWMKERGMICILVKSLVHTFSGLSGLFGSAVDERTRNDLYTG